MAILSIMVINNHGQPRLLKFYHDVVPHTLQTLTITATLTVLSPLTPSMLTACLPLSLPLSVPSLPFCGRSLTLFATM